MLADLVLRQALARPDSPAVQGPDGSLTYGALDASSLTIATALIDGGVRPGDRVAVWLDKTTRAVTSILAALRVGAAYVPIDPLAPVARARRILEHCSVSAVITSGPRVAVATEIAAGLGKAIAIDVDASLASTRILSRPAAAGTRVDRRPEDLAYVLYTSGSTGAPKGVSISHGAALAFVDWARAEVAVTADDRLANHAPLHFDLSVFDLHAAFAAGASVTLVPESMAYSPQSLVDLIARDGITVWYSVPSALMLMMDQGGLLETSLPALRAVIFAGEPFPIAHLRKLRAHLPRTRFLNFYGPTETNVCTFHEVRDLAPDRAIPVPIGRACAGDRVRVVRDDGADAGPGEEGELWVEGPTVMLGYWGEPPRQAAPYRTGDVVRVEPDGELFFVGRRDDMVKVRGNRIALGEIEAALLAHRAVREAAVVVSRPGTLEACLIAFLVPHDAGALPRPRLLEIKGHCAARLPRQMIVDRARWIERLPRTGNGKVDRAALAKLVETPAES